MQPSYTNVKVYNEIELCEIYDPECKTEIERELLKNRISFFIRWPKTGLFSRNKYVCVICINDSVREDAEDVVRAICDEKGYQVRFLLKRSINHFF